MNSVGRKRESLESRRVPAEEFPQACEGFGDETVAGLSRSVMRSKERQGDWKRIIHRSEKNCDGDGHSRIRDQ